LYFYLTYVLTVAGQQLVLLNTIGEACDFLTEQDAVFAEKVNFDRYWMNAELVLICAVFED
jgi:hypothetical protein